MKKTFIALCLCVFSTSVFAGAFAPVGKAGYVEATYPKFHETKEQCEQSEGHACYEVGDCPDKFCELVDNYALDYVAQRQYESCLDEADCDDKFSRIVCTEGQEIKNYESLSVYCAVNVMKSEGKKLVENAEKKAAYEAAQASKKQLEIELVQVQKARDCGSRAINVMSLRNAKKGLSKLQRKQILTIYEDIKNMLDVGSLDNAKDAINSATADGILITELDKSSMIESIVGCQ
jgi:hypothetical protein